MQCVDVTERLLEAELGSDSELDQHVAGCSSCAHVARGLDRLDSVLTSALIVVPPLDLQRQLAQLALDAARLTQAPWWERLPTWFGQLRLTSWLAQRPQMIAAQGLAAVMLALASWQVFGWVTAIQPVLGDVPYAMALVASSPAAVYVAGLQVDVQSLGVWTLVGTVGWLVSENGLIGRRLTSMRLRLP